MAERLLSDLGLGIRNVRELAEVERGQVVIASLMTLARRPAGRDKPVCGELSKRRR